MPKYYVVQCIRAVNNVEGTLCSVGQQSDRTQLFFHTDLVVNLEGKVRYFNR